MDIRVAGKHIDIGDTLPEQVRKRLQAGVAKYFDRGAEANVTFGKERGEFRADCHLHLDSGVTMRAHGLGADAYRAFDLALEHLEKQLRRYTRRLKNHHERVPAQNRPDAGNAS